MYVLDTDYPENNENETQDKEENVQIFTDRAVYRSGEKIQFKGIDLKDKISYYEPDCKSKSKVELFDGNGNKIVEKEFVSNNFGSFAGTFDIPKNILNGKWFLRCGINQWQIRVEDYKTPKLEIVFDPITTKYKLDDSVIVTGNVSAFSGNSLAGAKVKYKIIRNGRWNEYKSDNCAILESSEIELMNDGSFKIPCFLNKGFLRKNWEYAQAEFIIRLEVTDLNGETQQEEKALRAFNRKYNFEYHIPEQINRENYQSKNFEIRVSAKNIDDYPVEVKGNIKVYSLKSPSKLLMSRIWDIPENFIYTALQWSEKIPKIEYKDSMDYKKWTKQEIVFETSFNTSIVDRIVMKNLKNYQCGYYYCIIELEDDSTKYESYFLLNSTSKTEMPYPEMFLFQPLNPQLTFGEPAKILVGTSEKDVDMLVEVIADEKFSSSFRLSLSNRQKIISIPAPAKCYKFSVVISFTKNNRIFTKSFTFSNRKKQENLKIKFKKFENKLKPGNEYEWKLKIQNTQAPAEMVAVLYDEALDKYSPHQWEISNNDYGNYYYEYFGNADNYTFYPYDYSNSIEVSSYSVNYNRRRYYENSLPNLSETGEEIIEIHTYGNTSGIIFSGVCDIRDSRLGRRFFAPDPCIMPPKIQERNIPSTSGDWENVPPPPPPPAFEFYPPDDMEPEFQLPPKNNSKKKLQIRKDFSKTAFFYPFLKTDNNGEITVRFKVPESLTRWKMLGFAHTQNFDYGFVENELVTSKDLMIVPNLPRFFRQGDKITISAKINNLTSEKIKTQVYAEFFDAVSGKKTDIFSRQSLKSYTIDIEPNDAKSVNWTIQIPKNFIALKCRFVALAGNLNDGEETTLAVLPDKMFITESMPFRMAESGTKSFVFEKFVKNTSNTKSDYNYTVELCPNPVWNAIFALPYLIEFPHECSEQLFSRFYANTISSYIIGKHPQIETAFNEWQKNPEQNPLLSELEQNTSLKSVLLSQTPWYKDALSETAQRKQIANLFNNEKIKAELETIINKLNQNQYKSGGFPWFEGMQASSYITNYILAGFGQLKKLDPDIISNNQKIKSMLSPAIAFSDKNFYEEYLNYIKYPQTEEYLRWSVIQYIYARSFYVSTPLSEQNQKALDYFLEISVKKWKEHNLISKGMIAISLYRFGKKSQALDIAKSLLENSKKSDFGTFWEISDGYSWESRKIETQAMMIEVFHELNYAINEIDKMQFWLLNHKHSNHWDNTISTTKAIAALLFTRNNYFEDNKSIELQIGNTIIKPYQSAKIKKEAGSGMFRLSWNGDSIIKSLGKITITKQKPNPVIGSATYQYFEDIDKITSSSSDISIQKQMYIEKTSGNKIEYLPVNTTYIEVGQRVLVRLSVKLNRDLSYLHLTDMYASCFEPLERNSGFRWNSSGGYYLDIKDASMNFFFETLTQGKYVFEYSLRVNNSGSFNNGYANIQCMYAPELNAHTENIRIDVKVAHTN